jgi:SulP family sulfate permease
VIIGFTAGIAVNLLLGQVPRFFGLACGGLPVNFFEKLTQLCMALPSIDLPTTEVALGSLAVLVFSRKTPLRIIPGPVLALIFGIILQYIFQFASVATVGSAFGGIPNSLPKLHLPSGISLPRMAALIPCAFAIAMLGAIESLLSAVIADKITNGKHSSNQELIGQGIANVACPLFGGIASTGSITRTIASIRAGGNSPLAGIASSGALLFNVCFCAPLAKNIPLATLAAIIFVAAYNMSCAKTFAFMVVHNPRLDVITLIVTFLLTIVYGIVFAVNVGVMLSALILMYRLAATSDVSREQSAEFFAHNISSLPHEIAVYTISGPLFFGMIDKFEETIGGVTGDTKVLILRMQNVPFIDTSGLQKLRSMIDKFASGGRKIIISEAHGKTVEKLRRYRIFDSTDARNYAMDFNAAVEMAKKFCNG